MVYLLSGHGSHNVYKYSDTRLDWDKLKAGRGQMGQLTPIVANRISAGSRSVEYPDSQGGGNDRIRACVLLSEPEADVSKFPAFAAPNATTRSARQLSARNIQKRRGGREATPIPSVIYDVRPAPIAEVKSEPTGAPTRGDTLTESDVSNLKAILDHEIASSTLNNYRVQWGHFLSWAVAKGVQSLPAEPAQVAAYLAERLQEHGHKTRDAPSGRISERIRPQDRECRRPCAIPEVKRTLRCATRKAGREQKQAEALTEEAMSAIESIACEPRLGRGGRNETRRPPNAGATWTSP